MTSAYFWPILIGASVGLVCVVGLGGGMQLLISTMLNEKLSSERRMIRYAAASALLLGQAVVAGATIYLAPEAKQQPIPFGLALVAAILVGTALLLLLRYFSEKAK